MDYLFPFFGLTLAIAARDFFTRKIPNSLIILGAIYALLIALTGHGAVTLSGCVLGALVGGLVFLYPYQKSWLGAGDVKLMMITGGVLGPQAAAITALYAAVIGGIQALLVLFIRRMRQGSSFSKTTDSRIPYALAITLGGYLSVLKPGI